MATAQQYLIFDNTTAANFRSWAQAISLQLDAMGWTKTSDTGQVDWTTTPAVPAANVWTLYEIRTPASDPLQTGATAYYIRIEYGTKNTTAPNLRITIGDHTNGAGTLTGNVTTPSTVTNVISSTSSGTTPFECSFSWDTSRLGVMLWRNHTDAVAAPCFFGFERTKNSDGTDSSDGVTVVIASGGFSFRSVWQQTLVFGVGVSFRLSGTLGSLCATPDAGSGTTLAFNNQIPVSPVFPIYGKWANPITIAASVQLNDGVEGALVTTTLYGATRTYMMSKAISGFTSHTNNTFLMRYD